MVGRPERQWVEERFQVVLQAIPCAAVLADASGEILLVNDCAEQLFGYERAELIGQPIELLMPERFRAPHREHRARFQATPQARVLGAARDLCGRRRDGSEMPVEIGIGAIPTEQGMLFLGVLIDLTARKRAEETLLREREWAHATLDCIEEAVITTNLAGTIESMNPAAEVLTGWSFAEALGKPLAQVLHLFDGKHRHLPDRFTRCLGAAQEPRLTRHAVLISRGGQEFAIEVSVAPIRDRTGALLGTVLAFQDRTAAQRLAREMTYQATHDPLTGLVNRREFEQRLQRVLTTAHNRQTEHALCYLDLDQFKVINDTCGHAAGDELLRQLGMLLQTKVRKRDTWLVLGATNLGC